MAGARVVGDQTPEYQVTLATTPKQDIFLQAMMSGAYRYLSLGGAIRGTKSWTLFLAVLYLCKLFPRSRWAITRKDLPTLRANTIPSFEAFRQRVSQFIGPLNHSTWTYPCANGSQIIIWPESITADPEYLRWRGLEVNGFLNDEANELDERTLPKEIERAGTWIVPPTDDERNEMIAAQLRGDDPQAFAPRQPPKLILNSFNPADNWVRTIFYDPYMAGVLQPPYFFMPTTIRDNPFIPPERIKELEDLRDIDPVAYARFVLGDWGTISNPNQLISPAWIEAAYAVEPLPGPKRIGVDVARLGDDDITFAPVFGNTIRQPIILHHLTTDQVVDKLVAFIQATGTRGDNVTVDIRNMGAGVVDYTRKAGYNVRAFDASRKMIKRVLAGTALLRPGLNHPSAPDDVQTDVFSSYKFKNLRTQMAWEFREKLRLGRLRLEIADKEIRKRLYRELTAYEYHHDPQSKHVIVSTKDELKAKLSGVSPDVADAVMMAVFDWPQGQAVMLDSGTVTSLAPSAVAHQTERGAREFDAPVSGRVFSA